jgi:hypothetical protein
MESTGELHLEDLGRQLVPRQSPQLSAVPFSEALVSARLSPPLRAFLPLSRHHFSGASRPLEFKIPERTRIFDLTACHGF